MGRCSGWVGVLGFRVLHVEHVASGARAHGGAWCRRAKQARLPLPLQGISLLHAPYALEGYG